MRFLSAVEQKEHEAQEVEEDLAPLRRIDIIKRDSEQLSVAEQYRIDEFEAISRQLKTYFGLDFEVDHASALLFCKRGLVKPLVFCWSNSASHCSAVLRFIGYPAWWRIQTGDGGLVNCGMWGSCYAYTQLDNYLVCSGMLNLAS